MRRTIFPIAILSAFAALPVSAALLRSHPGLDTLVLECTNLPPYQRALEQALGLPVLDVLDLLADFHARLAARP